MCNDANVILTLSPLEQLSQLPACLQTQMMMKVYLTVYIQPLGFKGHIALFLTQMVRVRRRREEEEGRW